MHQRVQALQQLFLQRLTTAALPREKLLMHGPRGNFLTWRTAQARALQQELFALGIISDHRDDRLRLGFGLYHDPEDMEKMATQINQL